MSTLNKLIKKQAFNITTIPIALVFFFIAGCAGKQTAPQFTPDPSAFEFGVKQAVQVQLYTSKCGQVDPSLKAIAQDAKAYWNENNWPQASAADKHYSMELEHQTVLYNDEKIALPAVGLALNYDKDISEQLDEKRQSFSSIMAQCKYILINIKSGKLDIASNSNSNIYLKSLAQNPAGTPTALPTLAGSLKSHIPSGTAKYSAGQILQQSDCQQEEIYTLKHTAVFEDYAATCSNKRVVLVSCNLGQCLGKYLN